MHDQPPSNSSYGSARSLSETTADSFPLNVRLPICVASDHIHDRCHLPCQVDQKHWTFALKQIRRRVYHKTAVSMPPPSYHLLQFEKRHRNNPAHVARVKKNFKNSEILGPYFFNFNSDPLAPKDIFDYRALRSEHLLIKLAYQLKFARRVSQSIVRLAKGRFLVQQYGYVQPPHSSDSSPYNQCTTPTADTVTYVNNDTTDTNDLNRCLSPTDPHHQFLTIEQSDLTTIDTFTFNNLFQDIFNNWQQDSDETSTHNSFESVNTTFIDFIPFTYTIGVRYTHPYDGMRDIIVGGRIPEWCRTLIITECMRHLPIKPGMTLSGLLPFAKDMQFHFKQLSLKTDSHIYPDILVSYEKLTMDLCWPHSPFDTDKDCKPRQQRQPQNSRSNVTYMPSRNQAPIIATVPDPKHYQHALYLRQSRLQHHPTTPASAPANVKSASNTLTSPTTANSGYEDSNSSHNQVEKVDESMFTENILKSVVYCGIPNDVAALITDLANEWIASQQNILSTNTTITDSTASFA